MRAFDNEVLMGAHWLTCLNIPQSDGYKVFVVPDSIKEPARRMKLPSTMKGHRGRARTEPLVPRPMPLEQKPV